jgi:CcmD family protein
MRNKFSFFIFRLLCLFMGILFTASSYAQSKEVDMADVMRSNGKIYIVVAVCLTILIGLFFYVFLIDRKISKLEKEEF